MTILVIGYGNSLQSDDGAGQLIAQKVASWRNPIVRTHITCDLTPSLVSEIAQATVVVFVKAMVSSSATKTANSNEGGLQVHLVSPQEADDQWGHHCTPQVLLTLTQRLYNTLPQKSYWFWVPGYDFDFGEQLSALTQQGVQQALTQLSELIRSHEQKIRPRLKTDKVS